MDEEIIKLVKVKDFKGIEMIIDLYGASIVKTIRAILPGSYEQNYWPDVENEVFYDLWKKIAAYDPERSSLLTFILMVTRSRAIDRKRQLSRQQSETALPDDESLPPTEEQPLAREHFLVLIDHLSEIDQRIFLKFYFYQEKPEEIAADLTLAVSAVYNHLSRGKAKLKAQWAEGGAEHEF